MCFLCVILLAACEAMDYAYNCDDESAPLDDWLSIVIGGGYKDCGQIDDDEVRIHGELKERDLGFVAGNTLCVH